MCPPVCAAQLLNEGEAFNDFRKITSHKKRTFLGFVMRVNMHKQELVKDKY